MDWWMVGAGHWSMGYNWILKHLNKIQPGGTGILVTSLLAHQIKKPGDDPISLGCWCWVKIQGKSSQTTWLILMYWPCKSNGLTTIYQQFVHGLARNHVCPRDAVLTDLATAIKGWQEKGDNISLFMDMNEDIWLPWLGIFWLGSYGGTIVST